MKAFLFLCLVLIAANAFAEVCGPPAMVADPAQARPYQVGRTDYLLPAVPILNDSARLWATVRYPLGRPTGERWPLVIFLHGAHGTRRPATGDDLCTKDTSLPEVPNHLGFDYLLDNLAAAGYLAVSINANDLNCQADKIPERAELVLRHLALWKELDAGKQVLSSKNAPDFRGRVDFGRVGLLGNSRGGEAVVQAALANQDPGIHFGAVISVAPTDIHYLALTGIPYYVVLPAADGDNIWNEGAKLFNRASAGSGDAYWFKAQSYLYGANHNFFNSEWPRDEGSGPDRLTRAQQESWLRTYARAFFDATLLGKTALREIFQARRVPAGAPGQAYLSYVSNRRTVIDDFQATNLALASQGFDVFSVFDFQWHDQLAYNGTFYELTRGVVGTWHQGEPSFTAKIVAGAASANQAFSFRIAQVGDPLNQPASALAFDVSFLDTSGQLRTVSSHALGEDLPAPYLRDKDDKTLPHTVRFPFGCFDGMDPAALDAIRVQPIGRAQGAIAVEDMAFTE